MQPVDLQPIGNQLAIKWPDGSESFVHLERLRQACPCAGCQGETDILGHTYKNPPRPLPPAAFALVRIARVGAYGIQPVWADGHSAGIYSYEYLKELGPTEH